MELSGDLAGELVVNERNALVVVGVGIHYVGFRARGSSVQRGSGMTAWGFAKTQTQSIVTDRIVTDRDEQLHTLYARVVRSCPVPRVHGWVPGRCSPPDSAWETSAWGRSPLRHLPDPSEASNRKIHRLARINRIRTSLAWRGNLRRRPCWSGPTRQVGSRIQNDRRWSQQHPL